MLPLTNALVRIEEELDPNSDTSHYRFGLHLFIMDFAAMDCGGY